MSERMLAPVQTAEKPKNPFDFSDINSPDMQDQIDKIAAIPLPEDPFDFREKPKNKFDFSEHYTPEEVAARGEALKTKRRGFGSRVMRRFTRRP